MPLSADIFLYSTNTWYIIIWSFVFSPHYKASWEQRHILLTDVPLTSKIVPRVLNTICDYFSVHYHKQKEFLKVNACLTSKWNLLFPFLIIFCTIDRVIFPLLCKTHFPFSQDVIPNLLYSWNGFAGPCLSLHCSLRFYSHQFSVIQSTVLLSNSPNMFLFTTGPLYM